MYRRISLQIATQNKGERNISQLQLQQHTQRCSRSMIQIQHILYYTRDDADRTQRQHIHITLNRLYNMIYINRWQVPHTDIMQADTDIHWHQIHTTNLTFIHWQFTYIIHIQHACIIRTDPPHITTDDADSTVHDRATVTAVTHIFRFNNNIYDTHYTV
jgi:hypothetical protein